MGGVFPQGQDNTSFRTFFLWGFGALGDRTYRRIESVGEVTEDYKDSYLDERIREPCPQCNGVSAGRYSFTVRLVLIVCRDFELKLMSQHRIRW